MKTINWMNYEWIDLKPDGGPFHTDNPHMWYDDKCINILSDGTLSLYAKYEPKTFVEAGKTYTPEIGIGLVCSKKVFWHGKFEIYAKLPRGKWLWPAFWLTGSKTWPPEIDVFEGYSDKHGSYRSFQWNKPCAKYAVKTNAWKNVAPDQKQFGQSQHKAFKHPDDFNYFTLEWTEDEVKILFNSHLVRVFDDHKLVQQMNEQGMKVILNNGCSNDARGLDANYKSSSFLVKSFVYTPY